MRIQEISKLTGLSKKTLHFYINEGLIQPQKSKNNYYEFSETDIILLNQIIIFRKAGLSIKTIKEIYGYPEATNFFLHRSFNEIKQEITEKMAQLQNLEAILNTIPPNGTPVDVGNIPTDLSKQNTTNINWINQMYPSVDERVIACILLAPFMDIQVDEYKTYLWNKIFSDLKYHLGDNMKTLSKLIYSLNGHQIKEASVYAFSLMKNIAMANDISPYADQLLDYIKQMCSDMELQEKWKLLYHPIIIPIEDFFKRTANQKRISQYNPQLDQCNAKLNEIIHLCLQKLRGTGLEQELLKCLDKHISINSDSFSDLFILFTFHRSIFAQCSLDTIKEACIK